MRGWRIEARIDIWSNRIRRNCHWYHRNDCHAVNGNCLERKRPDLEEAILLTACPFTSLFTISADIVLNIYYQTVSTLR